MPTNDAAYTKKIQKRASTAPVVAGETDAIEGRGKAKTRNKKGSTVLSQSSTTRNETNETEQIEAKRCE